jgi:hypothetical protein
MNPEDLINFKGQDWHTIRAILKTMLSTSIDMLCSELTHDESQRIRGRIITLKDILALEEYSINANAAPIPTRTR